MKTERTIHLQPVRHMVTCSSQPVFFEMEMTNEMKLRQGTVEKVDGMKLGKRKNPKQNTKIPTIPTTTDWLSPGNTKT